MSHIVFDAVTYSINGRKIVGPLSFGVREGETLMLLGESGSGKTTTLRLVNAILMPTSGSVSVGGERTDRTDPVELRRRIGYVIQEVGLLPHLSACNNAGLVPRVTGVDVGEAKRRAQEMLRLVGLPEELWGRMPHELSGGQRQRVGVARALAGDPPVILCDEPFGALDPTTRNTLQNEFRDLTRRLNKTVVFVTHDVREAMKLGDRIAVMDGGDVAFLGTPDEFHNSDCAAVEALRIA